MRRRLTGADSADFHTRTAERYALLLGDSKGVLMKVGQMLSYMPNNFMVEPEHRPAYEEALGNLLNRAPPMAPELAEAVLERELGRARLQLLAEFDPEPIATASIGQVHSAMLRDGRAVAIKIQYPGVRDAIASDLKNLGMLAAFIGSLSSLVPRGNSRTDFRGMADELSVRVREELDYRLEAASQDEFSRLSRGHPFIHVPEVMREMCTERVLCQELLEGYSWEEALAADQELRDQWAEAVYRFVHGSGERFLVFPADPHPGNYLFHDDGSISALDFGCVKRFTPEQARYKANIGIPCVNGDALGTWQACVDSGLISPSDPVTPEEALDYWRGYIDTLWSGPDCALTPELAAAWMKRNFSPHGPSANFLRYSAMEPVYTLLGRIEVGTIALMAQLRANIDLQSIGAEYVLEAAPVTRMGKLDHAFFAR
jgi:predicted unusual protein kinase regulating ubiquinone biosynthesis (AarF/ABC1/UbiB family)